MRITSIFEYNKKIESKYTCDGEDVNPSLKIYDVPDNAQSLVLVMDDPDAVKISGKVWVHWLIWNIDPKTEEIKENSIPEGVTEGMTSFGKSGYGGPCPPSGTHRYFFKLYALDIKLSLDSSADKKKLEEAMTGHILDQVELIGLYR